MNKPVNAVHSGHIDEFRDTDLKSLEAILRTDKNRWFLALLFALVVIAGQIYLVQYAFDKAMSNKEVMYVKLYPDGSWDVVDYQSQDRQLYFKTTIDSLLKKFVEVRYRVNSTTIARDYGEAKLFMDGNLQREFVANDGFNAVQKAADAQNTPNDMTTITWRFNDHYDQIEGMVNGESAQVVRSNIYFTRERKADNGKFPAEKLMLRVQWRLVSKDVLANEEKNFVMVNPIGLKIVSMTLTQEPDLKEEK